MSENIVNILGCNINTYTMKETVDKVEKIISERKVTHHIVVNAAKIVMMQKDHKLQEIINSCGFVNPDGQSIVWASKFLGKPLPERVAGIDLMLNLIEISAGKGYRIFFLGARKETIEKVVQVLGNKYINLQIAGYRDGFFSEEENDAIVKQINASNADILFLGISSPKKEYWLAQNLNKLNVPFCMGVGGSFDVIAGLTKRAPLWMQMVGLEWFYRLIQEPKRMWKRYLVGNSIFLWLVLKEKLFD
jgi:N-acetylglucosaminyldiphosphoundecaprenol N-acetyl-beta-D-mannosaminyltransferase